MVRLSVKSSPALTESVPMELDFTIRPEATAGAGVAVGAAVVLTRPQLEQLRSCVTDSLAHDDAVRRRRGGDL